MQFKILSKFINNSHGEIMVYGDIVDEKWWDEDVTAKEIAEQINALKGISLLDVRINSYGGSVFAGNAIFNIIDTFKKRNNCKVAVYVDGIAASMGSGIAMVGDTIEMAENALMMVHKPWTMTFGNANDLQKTIEILEKTEEALMSNYMRHFKGTEDEMKVLLENETWLTAREALEIGLCTSVSEPIELVAKANGISVNNVGYSDKIAEIIKSKKITVKEEMEVKNLELKYDEKLLTFGLTEQDCKGMKTAQDVVDALCKIEGTDLKVEGEFISSEQMKEVLGAEMGAEEILSNAKAYQDEKETIESNKTKATMYDKLYNSAVADALKDAVKAKGETYNEARLKKYLNTLDYSEVLEQQAEWKEEASNKLNAGQRLSKLSNEVGVSYVDPDKLNY